MSRNPLIRLLRFLFFAVVVRAVVLVAIGLTVRHRERLPKDGPGGACRQPQFPSRYAGADVADAARPAAAPAARGGGRLFRQSGRLRLVRQEYHRHHSGDARRRQGGRQPAARARRRSTAATSSCCFRKDRGAPRSLEAFKKGIGHLACGRPQVPVIPMFMHGLGKVLPKGSMLPVPFNCIVSVGEVLHGTGDRGSSPRWKTR